MRPFMTSCILFMLLLPSYALATNAEESKNPSIENACKLATASLPNVGFDFCNVALTAQVGSEQIDFPGIIATAIRLAISQATGTMAQIEGLIDIAPDGPQREGLDHCIESFKDSMDHLNDALDCINSGIIPKTISLLGSALNVTSECDEAVNRFWIPPPLAPENCPFSQLVAIALEIAKSMQ